MKEMNIAYLSSAYLAPVEYYTKLLAYDKVFVEQYDHYIKQTYRNRCTIAGPSGELALSIPTVKPDTLCGVVFRIRFTMRFSTGRFIFSPSASANTAA